MIDAISGGPLSLAAARGVVSDTKPAATNETSGASFSDALKLMAQDMSVSLERAEAAAIGGVKGQVPVREVVETVLQAEQSLKAAIAVRDKVVAAYLELSRMQI